MVCVSIMHAHTHTHTHAYTHAHTHIHTHTYKHVSTWCACPLRTHIHTHTHTYTYTYTRTSHTHTHTHVYTHIKTCLDIDRGSSVKVKHSFVRELSNIVEFEYRRPLISDLAPALGRYLGRSYPGHTKSKSKARNRHGPHTAAKSEISGHIYSNSTILLN